MRQVKTAQVHLFKTSSDGRRGVTACGRTAWREANTSSEASTAAGARLEITELKHAVTCKRCRPN